jgi:hypothetical protein
MLEALIPGRMQGSRRHSGSTRRNCVSAAKTEAELQDGKGHGNQLGSAGSLVSRGGAAALGEAAEIDSGERPYHEGSIVLILAAM